MHVEVIIYSVTETTVFIKNIERDKCVVIDGYIYLRQ
jgi:hypothetical protein